MKVMIKMILDADVDNDLCSVKKIIEDGVLDNLPGILGNMASDSGDMVFINSADIISIKQEK